MWGSGARGRDGRRGRGGTDTGTARGKVVDGQKKFKYLSDQEATGAPRRMRGRKGAGGARPGESRGSVCKRWKDAHPARTEPRDCPTSPPPPFLQKRRKRQPTDRARGYSPPLSPPPTPSPSLSPRLETRRPSHMHSAHAVRSDGDTPRGHTHGWGRHSPKYVRLEKVD